MRYLAIAMLCVGLFSTPAFAKHHHRHHYRHHYVHHHRNHPVVEALGAGLAQILKDMHRPRDCYGIAWCGCFLKHYLHVESTRLNLNRAIEWRYWGHAVNGPQPGAVGVEPHHVFQVVKVTKSGRVLAISGNDSHAVRVRERSTRRVISWRMASLTKYFS